ncbi:MAG: BrnA antitoxin family protein [Chloroflexota bacterium]|nr:BrnA antitoxin family protein [Chloroflexia bacterium]MDQ3167765.1 BrnA antitoxin family protein [Chloroflexota bacterium]
MQKSENIVSYTADEIDEMRRRGESQTDWARVDAMTDEEVEAAIDHEDEGEFDWDRVMIGIPGPKRQLTVRFDGDLIEWFKAGGPGYQTRMNAVLRSYVEAQKRAELIAARRE